MLRIAAAGILIMALGGCSPAPKTPETPSATATFSIGKVAQEETDISGCTTMLSRSGGSDLDYVLLAGGDDAGTVAFIRIDNAIIKVAQTSQTVDEAQSTLKSLYAAKDNSLSIVEDLKMGEQHPDSDSVDMSGSLTVTYKGMTQTLPVEGGTAC